MTEGNVEFEPKSVSREALATLGEGHIAYVKQIRSEDWPGFLRRAVGALCPAPAPNRSLHVDLEAEVDFGSRHSAAQAPVFRRGLDERDLDVGRWNIERREIADDGLIKRSLGSHRSSGNIVTSTSVNFSPRPGGTAKCDARCSIRRSVRSPSGIFKASRRAD